MKIIKWSLKTKKIISEYHNNYRYDTSEEPFEIKALGGDLVSVIFVKKSGMGHSIIIVDLESMQMHWDSHKMREISLVGEVTHYDFSDSNKLYIQIDQQ